MKDLRQITAIGLGLLGGSITLRILRSLPGVKVVGYTPPFDSRKSETARKRLRKIINYKINNKELIS